MGVACLAIFYGSCLNKICKFDAYLHKFLIIKMKKSKLYKLKEMCKYPIFFE